MPPSTPPNDSRLHSLSVAFYAGGIFTVTWDMMAKVRSGGFNFKLHQGLFLIAFLLAIPAASGNSLQRLRKSGLIGFPACIVALDAYFLARAPWSYFPLKSLLYGIWILYNLCTIWGTAILISEHEGCARKLVFFSWLTAVFNGLVILADQAAYYQGFKGGVIGFNQDAVLHWGVSRPHAYSSEPSYAAMFLCLALLLSTFRYAEPKAHKRLALSFLALLACIYTTSRLGWAGFVAGSFFLVAIHRFSLGKTPWRFVTLQILGGALAAAIVLTTTPAREREALNSHLVSSVAQGADGSANTRLMAHIYAWTMAKETNWLGTGLGASYKYWVLRPESKLYGVGFGANDYGNQVVMSTWGELLAEGGIIALLAYFGAVASLVRALWRSWRRLHDGLLLGALGSALLFFTFVAFCVGNVARGDVWIWYAIWSALALAPGDLDESRMEARSAPL